MIKAKDGWKAFKNAGRTAWAGLALWGAMSLAMGAASYIVVGMHPVAGTWCKGLGYVQARFTGVKIKPWRPVKGSFNASVLPLDLDDEPGFEFVNDRTPDSAHPVGRNSFGTWRWSTLVMPEAVRMTMVHTNGTQEVLSTFGFYDVPRDIPSCTPSPIENTE